MIRALLLLFIVSICTASCKADYEVTKAVRPKKHLFAYNPKWHKKFKRTHYVKLKH